MEEVEGVEEKGVEDGGGGGGGSGGGGGREWRRREWRRWREGVEEVEGMEEVEGGSGGGGGWWREWRMEQVEEVGVEEWRRRKWRRSSSLDDASWVCLPSPMVSRFPAALEGGDLTPPLAHKKGRRISSSRITPSDTSRRPSGDHFRTTSGHRRYLLHPLSVSTMAQSIVPLVIVLLASSLALSNANACGGTTAADPERGVEELGSPMTDDLAGRSCRT
ncbi:unnamed protein product [Lampetra planeri]